MPRQSKEARDAELLEDLKRGTEARLLKEPTGEIEAMRAFFRSYRADRTSPQELKLTFAEADLIVQYRVEETRAWFASHFDGFLAPTSSEVSATPAMSIWYHTDMRKCLDRAMQELDAKFRAVFRHAWHIVVDELVVETLISLNNGQMSRHFDETRAMLNTIVQEATDQQRQRLKIGKQGRPAGSGQFRSQSHLSFTMVSALRVARLAGLPPTQPNALKVMKEMSRAGVDVPAVMDAARLRQVLREFDLKWPVLVKESERIADWFPEEPLIKSLLRCNYKEA